MSDRPEPSRGTVSRRAVLSTVGAASAFGALSPGVAATGRPERHAVSTRVPALQEDGRFEYVVKFLCGFSEGEALVPGAYRTDINVHNPNEEGFEFEWKVAVARPDEPGEVTAFDDVGIGRDEAVEIDCRRIAARLDTDERFFKGFVVIRSDLELDVVAVYTAAGAEQLVETLDVEDVPAREGRREPDGEGDGLPDLVPEVVGCDGVVVRVTNRGTAPAAASRIFIGYGRHGSDSATTPPLGPGESHTHRFVPPLGCHDPDCDFTVAVDADDAVDESDEANNVLEDVCIG